MGRSLEREFPQSLGGHLERSFGQARMKLHEEKSKQQVKETGEELT